MGLFSFFRKKKVTLREKPLSIDHLMVDMHGHFLPGLDDGSPSMEDSVAMLKAMEDWGYKKVICTPHVMHGHFQNSTEAILLATEALRSAAEEHGLSIAIEAAAEYNFDSEFVRRIEENDLLSFGYDDYKFVLFELSYFNEPVGLLETMKQLKEQGYIPVLAHPERYPYFRPEKLEELRNMGILLQLNLNSLADLYPEPAKETATYLLEKDLVDFIGTDAHRVEHVDLLENSLRNDALNQFMERTETMNKRLL